MTDYALEIRRRLLDPWQLCSALGLTQKAKKSHNSVQICCPWHAEKNPSCTVRIAEDGTIGVRCHACGTGGDALTLIAQVRGLNCDIADDFREVMAIGAEISGSASLADEIRSGNRGTWEPAPAPQPEPERDYPPLPEVGQLWQMAIPVETDPDAKACLEARSICPASSTRLGLARVIGRNATLGSPVDRKALRKDSNAKQTEQAVRTVYVSELQTGIQGDAGSKVLQSKVRHGDGEIGAKSCEPVAFGTNGTAGSNQRATGSHVVDGTWVGRVQGDVTDSAVRSCDSKTWDNATCGSENGFDNAANSTNSGDVHAEEIGQLSSVRGGDSQGDLHGKREYSATESGCNYLPPWARYGKQPWSLTGHRLIVQSWDAAGKLRSVRAWQLYGGSGPKRLPPTGHKQAGLVQANAQAVKLLRGQAAAGRVLICEGEPDWLTWSTRVPADVAVIGIGSGSWTPEYAKRLPTGSEVIVLTHRDKAGDEYARQVIDTIPDSVQAWRLNGPEGIDENDKAKAGTLPKDPRANCVPVNDAAKKAAAAEPVFYTVKELLVEAHKRLTSEEPPLMWTSGHWKVDLMTGGLRPETGWVIGAASSWGKSSIGIAIADENLRNWRRKGKVLIASCEDSEDVYADRLLARRARVNAFRLRDRCLKYEEQQRVCAVLEHAEPIPFFLDGRGIHFERLLGHIDRMILEHDIDIVILDYIQETRTKQKFESERVMFREIARTFRHLVKRRKKCSVILTQLTQPEPGKPPTKDNIRECKDIGHGAEVIAMGWEPQTELQYGDVTFPAGSKLLLLDKTKSGRKATVELSWDSVSACFDRVVRPAHAEDEERKWYDADGKADLAMQVWMNDLDDINQGITG